MPSERKLIPFKTKQFLVLKLLCVRTGLSSWGHVSEETAVHEITVVAGNVAHLTHTKQAGRHTSVISGRDRELEASLGYTVTKIKGQKGKDGI